MDWYYTPFMSYRSSRRAVITARRKRDRLLAREKAWREWVCGGPLIEHDKPIMTVADDAMGQAQFWAEMVKRTEAMNREARLLAVAFADRCYVLIAERERMVADLTAVLGAAGQPFSAPVATTNQSVLDSVKQNKTVASALEWNPTEGPRTIPRL